MVGVTDRFKVGVGLLLAQESQNLSLFWFAVVMDGLTDDLWQESA